MWRRAQYVTQPLGAKRGKSGNGASLLVLIGPSPARGIRRVGARRPVATHDHELEFVAQRRDVSPETLIGTGRVVIGPIGAKQHQDDRLGGLGRVVVQNSAWASGGASLHATLWFSSFVQRVTSGERQTLGSGAVIGI